MLPSISDQKANLRQHCKSIRKELGDEVRRQSSQAICESVAAWEVFQSSVVILTYMPMRTEVDLRSLLDDFPEKRWYLPRIIPEENHRMVFHLYEPEQLIKHPFGMAEPAPHLPQISSEEIDLVLVPGLAFDRSGWRLGYGGGYFDLFLKDFKGASVGVVFQPLLFEALPHSEHDIPVGWLVTENRLIRSGELRNRSQSARRE